MPKSITNKKREMKNKTQNISLGGVLFLIFLILKLAGVGVVATWSWVWVLSPMWIPFALIMVAGFILGVVLFIKKQVKKV
jgi:membrane protein YdbS with pleckstrin-like domain